MSAVTVKAHHIPKAGLCMRGARQWFSLHGIDYADFIQNGISSDKVLALNDALGDRVVQIAIAEAEGEDE
jgi:arsenate reductase-like glutaredoxin family protein